MFAVETQNKNKGQNNSSSNQTPTLQRKCACGGVCSSCKSKGSNGKGNQSSESNLSISQPNDFLEQEADRVADQVVSDSSILAPSDLSSDELFSPLMRKHNGENNSSSPIGVSSAIQSPGRKMDSQTQSFMEHRFGHNFNQIRVHDDANAAASAKGINAKAYTVGNDIVFGNSQYRPNTQEGKHLLAHELTHSVQQESTGPKLSRQEDTETDDAASPPTVETAEDVGRGGGRFDATIDRNNCLLTALMKVKFNYVDTPEAWPNDRLKNQWQRKFVRKVTNRWSGKYDLEPESPPCEGETCNRLSVAVQVQPVETDEHFDVTVGYTSDFEGSYVAGRTATLDSLDVEERDDIPQTPAEHEFGHMLGLPHVRCDRNDPICYGVTDEEKANVMGEGENVSERDYRIFSEAADEVSDCNWKPVPTKSVLGRVFAGIAIGGILGAGIGAIFGPIGALVGGLIGGLAGGLIGGLTG